MKLFARVCLLVTFALCSAQGVFAHGSEHFPQIKIVMNGLSLHVDHASTPQARAHGLQHKKYMCDDCGMLFEFEYPRIVSFWMKNTFLPLDIAYITEDGLIVDIRPMEPFNENGILSNEDVLYALEMHQGWFESHHIKVGDTIQIQSTR